MRDWQSNDWILVVIRITMRIQEFLKGIFTNEGKGQLYELW